MPPSSSSLPLLPLLLLLLMLSDLLVSTLLDDTRVSTNHGMRHSIRILHWVSVQQQCCQQQLACWLVMAALPTFLVEQGSQACCWLIIVLALLFAGSDQAVFLFIGRDGTGMVVIKQRFRWAA